MKLNKIILFAAMLFVSISAVSAAPVNVTSFGAIGNGSTDNLTAIQNAIDSLPPSGGTIYFPEGYFDVSGTLHVPSNVRFQGMGSFFNCQIRLTSTGVPLFEVGDGVSNVIFKDLTLVAFPNGVWPRSHPSQVLLIRGENTTGISLKAAGIGISHIEIENVRINQFTQGVLASSASSYPSASITDVLIRNYASDGNEYALRANTKGADLWDVQNVDVYPMYKDQNGIFLESSGRMSFLQLNCAGADGGICAKLWNNGDTYFRNMHTEEARLAFCVGSDRCDGTPGNTGENSSVLTIENSPSGGHFYRATNLVSINNRFWLDYPTTSSRPYYFYGTGAGSSLVSCADVWVSNNPYTHITHTTVVPPIDPFPGLATKPLGCLRDYLAVPSFAQGYVNDDERLDNEVDVTASPYNAVPNDGIDDTSAFVAALNAATTSANPNVPHEKRVFVPAGTFDVASTLQLYGGESFVGEEGSVIRLNGENRSLFKIVAVILPQTVKGITFRNLKLAASSNVGTIGISMENFSAAEKGGAVDFQIQGVDFEGFDVGLAAYPVNWDHYNNANPMYDSISVKDAEFVGNNIGLWVKSANASNWNVEKLKVVIPNDREGIRVEGPGNFSLRNIACSSPGTGAVCVNAVRQNGLAIDGLTASDVIYALRADWENGQTQFPITLRNSNLLAGVYFQGRVYLNSVNNLYPTYSGRGVAPAQVRFGALYEDHPGNVAPGEMSDIFSCDDTFIDLSTMQTSSFWAYAGNLTKPVTYCQ